MLNVLKSYDTATAEGLLARTSFYLEENPILHTFGKINNEENLRNDVIREICANLRINSPAENKKAIIDYIDTELEKSMALDKAEEKNILIRLSDEARLPTDLYHIKPMPDIRDLYRDNIDKETSLIASTIKGPDFTYHFNTSGLEITQKDISIFAKYHESEYSFNNFYLLVIGRRAGLDFIVTQVWHVYNDIVDDFSDALDLLKIFVDKFGIEVKFQGEVSKFFLSKIARNEKEFEIIINENNVTRNKKGNHELTVFHFVKSISGENKSFSLFFVIDILKYKNHLLRHKYKI